MVGLADLYDTILMQIFQYLNKTDVYSCLRVNSKFHQVIERNRCKFPRKVGETLEIIQQPCGLEIDVSQKHNWRFSIKLDPSKSSSEQDKLLKFKEYLYQCANLSGADLDGEFPSISTNDVDSCLREYLYYYLSRVIPSRVLLGNMSTTQLQIVEEIIMKTNSKLEKLFINIDQPLNVESLPLLNFIVSELVIISQRSQHIPVEAILSMESVSELSSISLESFQNVGSEDVSHLFRQLQATTIRLPKAYPIDSESFRKFINEWLHKIRSIDKCNVFVEYSGNNLQGLLEGIDCELSIGPMGITIITSRNNWSLWAEFRKLNDNIFFVEIRQKF